MKIELSQKEINVLHFGLTGHYLDPVCELKPGLCAEDRVELKAIIDGLLKKLPVTKL